MARLPENVPHTRELPKDLPSSVKSAFAQVTRELDQINGRLRDVIRELNRVQTQSGTIGRETTGSEKVPTVQSKGTLARDLLLMGG